MASAATTSRWARARMMESSTRGFMGGGSEEKYTFNWTVLGGFKVPTGDSSKLNTPDSDLPDGIGGHDLALGSGSYDGIVGTGIYGRWKRGFVTASVQYAIRSEGDFQHRYANDLTWF